MLWNSYLFTIFPIFSFLLTPNHTFPSMNSSPHRTGTGTYPHLSQTPCSLRWDPVPFLDSSSCFTSFVFGPFRSSSSPSDCGSPFHISYAFLFGLCSRSTFAMQHRFSILLPLSMSYHPSPLFSHWLSDVVAYPESYLELWFSLRSVLYKVTQPLVCSLASSTQFSLVSSLLRFALRPTLLKPSLN